jgi:hypothetical protein
MRSMGMSLFMCFFAAPHLLVNKNAMREERSHFPAHARLRP